MLECDLYTGEYGGSHRDGRHRPDRGTHAAPDPFNGLRGVFVSLVFCSLVLRLGAHRAPQDTLKDVLLGLIYICFCQTTLSEIKNK